MYDADLEVGMGTTGSTPGQLTAVYCTGVDQAGVQSTTYGDGPAPCFTCKAPGGTRVAASSGSGHVCTLSSGYALIDGFVQECPIGFYRENTAAVSCTACAAGRITLGTASTSSAACVATTYASTRAFAASNGPGAALLSSAAAGQVGSWSQISVPSAQLSYDLLTAPPRTASGYKLLAVQNPQTLLTVTDENGWSSTSTAIGTSTGPFTAIVASASGSRVAVAEQTGKIYLSADGGSTWSIDSGSITGTWSGLAMSSSGQLVFAVQASFTGKIYRSIDYGATWSDVTPGSQSNWVAVACSSSGKHAVALQSGTGGDIFISSDYGATWAADNKRATAALWSAVAMSGDGRKILAAQSSAGGKLYTGTLAGSTWSWLESSMSGDWRSVTMTFDGSIMLAVVNDSSSPGGSLGRIYQYSATGSGSSSWVDVTPDDTPREWSGVTMAPL